ncbi:hypothetical protein [Desulfoscipio gibsoniae]|uniref:Uncharacterized protein n=1 Tax=Desulfoscipio gibsoniae DSM 7213 TaxID=767817 RepID=R4KB04_9FIRM|nr:hypothetical protein [Desulfoscipio gibsoniae]AGK99748.1 hypothetical protein Desgi_0135 [Desulfoscipio gibsoniae DSM 7213]
MYYADQSLMKAREALVKAGVQVPDKFDLELDRYAKRGVNEVTYNFYCGYCLDSSMVDITALFYLAKSLPFPVPMG